MSPPLTYSSVQAPATISIGGVEPCTFIDFPGRLAAIVFTRGCNLRCPYCHNANLLENTGENSSRWSDEGLFTFLEQRRGRLSGVVVTGGEPTLHQSLPGFLRRIKDLGYAVKLDTNGTRPLMLAQVLEQGLVDFIALDAKAHPDHMEAFGNGGEAWLRSLALIKNAGISHEFRTTVMADFHDAQHLESLAKVLHGGPTAHWYLQAVRPGTTLVEGLKAPDRTWLQAQAKRLSCPELPCHLRG